jgi:hypothetical protein
MTTTPRYNKLREVQRNFDKEHIMKKKSVDEQESELSLVFTDVMEAVTTKEKLAAYKRIAKLAQQLVVKIKRGEGVIEITEERLDSVSRENLFQLLKEMGVKGVRAGTQTDVLRRKVIAAAEEQ